MADSPIPLLKWVYAIYVDITNLKGVSSMKLHRDLGVTQKTAWFMQQRIREAFEGVHSQSAHGCGGGVDETYVGGIERNKHQWKKRNLGRGPVGKTAVVGVRERSTGMVTAKVVHSTDAKTLQGFVHAAAPGADTIYTDGSTAYDGLPNREAVYHSVGEYVRGKAHTNGVESFWGDAETGAQGHVSSPVRQAPTTLMLWSFGGRHNIRELDTGMQMGLVAWGMVGRRLTHERLTDGDRAWAH